LKTFESLVPPPPGSVLEAGTYEEDYAYVVTRLTSDESLEKWLGRRETASEATNAGSALLVQSPDKGISAIDGARQSDGIDSPSEFTRWFSPSEGANASAGTGDLDDLQAPTRGRETERDSSRGRDRAGSLLESMPIRASGGDTIDKLIRQRGVTDPGPRGTEPNAGTALNTNSAAFDSTKASGTKPGEFTVYFRGPFGQDQAVSRPELETKANLEPEKESSAGEFTVLFGRNDGSAKSPAWDGAPQSSQDQDEKKDITQLWLQQAASAKQSRPDEPVTGDDRSTPGAIGSVTLGGCSALPTLGNEEQLDKKPAVSVAKLSTSSESPVDEPLFFERSREEHATSIFNPPQQPAIDPPQPVAIRQSDYTRVVSRATLPAPQEPALSAKDGSLKPPSPSRPENQVVMPPPKVPTPPVPAPHLPVPTVPWPPASDPPTPPAVPAPKVSYWPLILILNGLFIVAVLLVLYFALKR